MLSFLRRYLREDSPLRLLYSWSKAFIAKMYFRNPSRDLIVIGVTGTDGKTSTTHFTAELLELLGETVAMSSTEEIWMAGERRNNATKRTTLSPWRVQSFLSEARKQGCRVVIIEVSSHALVQGRVSGVDFDAAILTNISREHTNYHHTMEAYAEAKSRLFTLVVNSPKSHKQCFLNAGTQYFEIFQRAGKHLISTYGLSESADLRAVNLIVEEKKTDFILSMTGEKGVETSGNPFLPTTLHIPGAYNVENILASTAVARWLGHTLEHIALQIPLIHPVAGRLEGVENDLGLQISIDFAVTPGAFEKLLEFAKKTTKGRVIIVFGATGANHDHDKRPMLGEIASRLADQVFLTEDETYGEENEKIMSEVEGGFHPQFHSYEKVAERGEAIRKALTFAKSGDTVLITGMGAFTSRNNGNGEIEWSDRGVVEEWMKELRS